MNCKYCNAELEEGVTLCPVCGNENAQEPEAVQEPEAAPEQAAQPEAAKPKRKTAAWKVILAVCGGLVLLAALSFALLKSLGVDIRLPTNDLNRKSSYTAKNPEKTASTVVAKISDAELTNGQLQIYYWSQVEDFLDYMGAYAAYMGLDVTAPLDSQKCPADENMTWQQYFLQYALESWQRYQILVLMAQETGMELDAEVEEALAELPAGIEVSALESGYANGDALVQNTYGTGITVRDYVEYMRTYYTALQYFNMMYESVNPSPSELEAYFHEHAEEFAESGVTMESGNWVDARHILIMPKGGTKDKDGNTVYSEEEWEICRATAQSILDEWLAGDATEESFAALANEHSDDPGSNTNGGLYTQWKPTDSLLKEYKDWIFDESRKPGDYGLVKTDSGYHIMYFVQAEEGWLITARTSLISDRANQLIDDAIARWPMDVTYKKIALGDLDLSAYGSYYG